MNKKTLILVLLSVVSLVFLSGIVIVTVSHARDTSPQVMSNDITEKPTPSIIDRDNDYTYNPPVTEDDNSKPVDTDLPFDEPFVPATEMDLDPSSITVFINKEYTLPKNYKPDDLVTPNIYFDLTYYDERTLMRPEAAEAIERLFLAAQNEGYVLSGVSGYRSYARQKKIFTTNILTKGKTHTLKYSAVPGTSEHQTGLAMDVSCEALGYDLSTRLANMPEGIWLAENAYRYGFIIRYPKGKSDITGYAYEPWHIRYVGRGLAKYLYENDLTLEEYYNYVPSEDFNFELMYADLINITPSPTTLPLDGEGLIIGENGEIIEGELGEETTPSPTPTTSPTGTITPTPTPPPTPTIKPSITPTITPSITPSITPTTTPEDEDEEDDNATDGDQDPSGGDDTGAGSGEEGSDPNAFPTPPFSTNTENSGSIIN